MSSHNPVSLFFPLPTILTLSFFLLRYVAFARDAGNIAQGAKNGARVIYGDGCEFNCTLYAVQKH